MEMEKEKRLENELTLTEIISSCKSEVAVEELCSLLCSIVDSNIREGRQKEKIEELESEIKKLKKLKKPIQNNVECSGSSKDSLNTPNTISKNRLYTLDKVNHLLAKRVLELEKEKTKTKRATVKPKARVNRCKQTMTNKRKKGKNDWEKDRRGGRMVEDT